MPWPRFPALSPANPLLLGLLCALYLLPGLLGHDLWKGEDTTHFGVVHAMLVDGHWLFPHLAGEPWFDTPPLYYWVSALLAKLLGEGLGIINAARLATGLFAFLMMAALAAAARRLSGPGPEARNGALLMSLGCLGLLVHAHELQPAIGFLAATAVLYLALAELADHPGRAGALLAVALSLGFLCAGLDALLVLAATSALAVAACAALRTRAAARGLALGWALALPVLTLWPALLHGQAPALFGPWWAHEVSDLLPDPQVLSSLGNSLKLLGWFAWPVLPLALWTLWRERRRLGAPRTLIPLLSLIVSLIVLSPIEGPRGLNALPLLPPLILLAAPATASLRRGAANAFDWFGMMTFTILGALIWLGWLATTFGVPAQLARNLRRLEPGFVGELSALACAVALALTFAWLMLIFSTPRAPQRGSLHWAAGLTFCWGLLMALWQPMIDYDRSYRPLGESLARALPARHGCIAGHELGDSQRAAFHVFAGITTVPAQSRAARACRLHLAQGSPRQTGAPTGAGWRLIWQGHRPSDRNERFRLYQRS